jgi:molecular chaperone GrpE
MDREHDSRLGRSQADAQEPGEIRVTDRRRIRVGEEVTAGTAPNTPSLKPTYVEELEARTRAAEQHVLEIQARFEEMRSRLQRETDETRQRLNRAADERAERANSEFIANLLPALDNLRRAIEATQSGSPVEAVLSGLRGTVATFEASLAAAGVEPLAAVGEIFDPELHEAVDTAEVPPADDGKVLAEYARGYRMGGRLLRPSRVQVGRTSRAASEAH